jgi:hypothetical protein
MQGQQPYWKSIFLSATRCGSGCVIGDIIGAPIVLATGWVLLGERLYSEYAVEFALAYLFGIAFPVTFDGGPLDQPLRLLSFTGTREAGESSK